MQAMLYESTLINGQQDTINFIVSILESSTEYSIVATDLDGLILLWNEGARRVYGYEPIEVVGKLNGRDLCAPNEQLANNFVYILELMQKKGKWEGLVHRIRKNGEQFIARVVITPRSSQQGKIVGFLIMSKDTSKELLLEELKAEQLYTRSLIEASFDALMTTNLSGIITDVNYQMCEITGYSNQDLIGSSASTFVTEPERVQALITLAMTTGQVANYEMILRSREGQLTPVSCNAVTIFRRNTSNVLGVYIAARNITHQKYLEQELQVKHQELQRQNYHLQRADRLKSEFLANMSHELRTPLNSIIGYSEMLHEGVIGPVPDDQKSCLDEMLKSSRHLLHLINDVLDLAKVEAGKMEFHPEPVELNALFEDVQAIVRPLIYKKNLCVTVDVDPSINSVMLDPSKFKQVLYNYLSNAIKFTPENGKISVRVTPEAPASLRLEVADTGIGICAEDMERLFVEFQQLDSSLSKQYQGTGLGLALTKHLIEAQGGHVGVRSTPGVGSTFFLVLPCVTEIIIGEENEQTISLPVSVQGRPDMLIVEDDARELRRLAMIALEAGYNTDYAMRGTQAREKCRSKVFDCIILDLILPDIDGWDLLQAIRSDGPNSTTPIVVITLVTEEGTGAGFNINSVFTKPITPEKVLETMKRLKKVASIRSSTT